MNEVLSLSVLTCLIFSLFYLFYRAIGWAKKRKSGAIFFGVMVSMFLPDPKIHQTIEIVAEQKAEKAKPANTQSDKKP